MSSHLTVNGETWRQIKREPYSQGDVVTWKRDDRDDYLICETREPGYGESGEEVALLFHEEEVVKRRERRYWTDKDSGIVYKIERTGRSAGWSLPEGGKFFAVRGSDVNGAAHHPEDVALGALTDDNLRDLVERAGEAAP